MKREQWEVLLAEWEHRKDPSLVNIIRALIDRIQSLEGSVESLKRHLTENVRDVDKRLADLEIAVGTIPPSERLEHSQLPPQPRGITL